MFFKGQNCGERGRVAGSLISPSALNVTARRVETRVADVM